MWVERLALTNFRNYSNFTLQTGPQPVVLTGPNGAGKTNLLEAISLLAAGQGLRRAAYADLARASAGGDWAVAARLHTFAGPIDIGTGLQRQRTNGERAGRIVKIGGDTQSGSGVLAEYVEMVWLTPAMDGLLTGVAADRRRFLDRLILCFDPAYRKCANRFERAMQQRNRLLADGVRDPSQFEGLERIMAEAGIAIAAARVTAVAQIAAAITFRRGRTASPFPWAEIALDGSLEAELSIRPAIEVEDQYVKSLSAGRERDRSAGRALAGPHRSDLVVKHGPNGMPAKLCSTGEQKALLIGLVLAHAELAKQQRHGAAPILLLDEIVAHLDPMRRSSLFAEITGLSCQAWMTGTDHEVFAELDGRAQFHRIVDGTTRPLV
jgi:DNA replication and repair protein RecF